MTPALEWLYGTQLFGMKLGLENVRALLSALHLPAPGQRFIHVAGTNGKGSTCAFMHAILREAEVNAGLFTSPHLIRFNERIRDAEREITAEEIEAGIGRLQSLCGHLPAQRIERDPRFAPDAENPMDGWHPHPTFFELTLALALDWFRLRGNPWVILETGLGGRLDATNAITPAVSVITAIGMDHMNFLGDTLEAIAAEKAGIIKAGVPVVSAPQEPAALEVIRETAMEMSSPLIVVDSPCDLPLGLAGPHQRWNAAVAIAALRAAGFDFTPEVIAAGLRKTVWAGRFQRLDGRTILDGAHNEPGARALVAAWEREFPGERATIIFGGSTGKDTAAILHALAPIAARWVFTSFDSPRALPAAAARSALADDASHAPVECAASIAHALELTARHRERRLIAGSLFFAGEVLACWGNNAATREPSAQ